jgi:hypothetical protein
VEYYFNGPEFISPTRQSFQMQKILVIIIFVYSFNVSYGQSLGMQGNLELSENQRINKGAGGGIYLDLADSSERKIESLFSINYCKRKRNFSEKGFESDYLRYYVNANALYVFYRSKKSKLRIGPFLGYNVIEAGENSFFGTIHSYKSRSVGTGLAFNFELQNVAKSGLNFDIFVCPTYLASLTNESAPFGSKSQYRNNLTLLNIQIGISYLMK